MFACIFCILIIEIATIVWASSEILAATNNYLLVILHIVISLFVGITSAKYNINICGYSTFVEIKKVCKVGEYYKYCKRENHNFRFSLLLYKNIFFYLKILYLYSIIIKN